jgi:hypothetical protein
MTSPNQNAAEEYDATTAPDRLDGADADPVDDEFDDDEEEDDESEEEEEESEA